MRARDYNILNIFKMDYYVQKGCVADGNVF